MALDPRHQDLIPSVAAGELEAQRQASIRAWEALMLARTPEAWAQLLRGQPVPRDQLDQGSLRRARRRTA